MGIISLFSLNAFQGTTPSNLFIIFQKSLLSVYVNGCIVWIWNHILNLRLPSTIGSRVELQITKNFKVQVKDYSIYLHLCDVCLNKIKYCTLYFFIEKNNILLSLFKINDIRYNLGTKLCFSKK